MKIVLRAQSKRANADRQTLIQRLEERRGEPRSIGVCYLATTGSLARDEARKDSDIVVALERPAGLVKHANLQNYLAALLEPEVDVGPRTSIRPELENQITREAVRVL